MKSSNSIQIWREKLEFLRKEEARSCDPDQKFALQQRIEEAAGKIAELNKEADLESLPKSPPTAPSRSQLPDTRILTAVTAAAVVAFAGGIAGNINNIAKFWRNTSVEEPESQDERDSSNEAQADSRDRPEQQRLSSLVERSAEPPSPGDGPPIRFGEEIQRNEVRRAAEHIIETFGLPWQAEAETGEMTLGPPANTLGGLQERRLRAPPNATVILDGRRVIIHYNSEFMEQLRKITGTDWSVFSVVAHEIAHRFNPQESGPDAELTADEWSGFALGKLGASLEEAQAIMIISGNVLATSTHPARRDRLVAIEQGWRRATDAQVDSDHASSDLVDAGPEE